MASSRAPRAAVLEMDRLVAVCLAGLLPQAPLARKRDCCLILILHTTRMDHTASHLIWRHRRELDATQCRLRRVVSLAPGLFSNLFLFPPVHDHLSCPPTGPSVGSPSICRRQTCFYDIPRPETQLKLNGSNCRSVGPRSCGCLEHGRGQR